jgi:hypothetical protein
VHLKNLRGLKEFKKDYPPAKCYLFYSGSASLYMGDIIILPPWAGITESEAIIG